MKRIPKKYLVQNVPNASYFFNFTFSGSKFVHSQLKFTCSKSTIGTLKKVWNMFKANNKNTRMMSNYVK